ncbi:MAG: hypothetical protein M3R08_06130 [Bacteroidota bacterium]|nr:hypothetical protein [Bacteroidota bacterium]
MLHYSDDAEHGTLFHFLGMSVRMTFGIISRLNYAAFMLLLFLQGGSHVIAQFTSRHYLQEAATFMAFSKLLVYDQTGPLKDVFPKPAVGASFALRYKYVLDESNHWVGAEGELGVYFPRITVKIPYVSVSGAPIPPYERLLVGPPSADVWYWSILYGRFIAVLNTQLETFIGIGLVQTPITILHPGLHYINDSTSRGGIALGTAWRSRVAPVLRLGIELIKPRYDKNSWSLGVSALISGRYVEGVYILMPQTIYESSGRLKGGLNYVGIRIGYQFNLGRKKTTERAIKRS